MQRLSLIVGVNEVRDRCWLVSTLEDMGGVVQQVFCGWELLRLLSTGSRIDLVISDVGLPSPSGLRTLALARTMGIDVPFLFIANSEETEAARAASRLGAGVLSRPLSVDVLARTSRMTYRFVRAAGPPTTFH